MLIRKGGICREIRPERLASYTRKGYMEVAQSASVSLVMEPAKPLKPAPKTRKDKKSDGS